METLWKIFATIENCSFIGTVIGVTILFFVHPIGAIIAVISFAIGSLMILFGLICDLIDSIIS